MKSLIPQVKRLCYMSMSFEERRHIVSEFLKSTPDYSDAGIADAFNTTELFVKRERAFLGIPPYVYTSPEPEPEPITTPEMLTEEQKENQDILDKSETPKKRGRSKYRPDVWAHKNAIVRAFQDDDITITALSDYFKCSGSLIRKVLNI